MTNGPADFDRRWPWAGILITSAVTVVGCLWILLRDDPGATERATLFAGIGGSVITTMFGWIKTHEHVDMVKRDLLNNQVEIQAKIEELKK